MTPHERSHGKEYRLKIVQKGQPVLYTSWLNTSDAARQMAEKLGVAPGQAQIEERDWLCQDCAKKEAKITVSSL